MPSSHYLEEDSKKLYLVRFDHDDKKVEQCLGAFIYLKKIYKVFDDDNRIELLLESSYAGETISHTLPRKNLVKHELVKLADKGFDVIDSYASYFAESIRLQEQSKKASYCHEHVGFDYITDLKLSESKLIFKGYKGLGIKSKYIGQLDLIPIGDIIGFRAFVQENIIGTPLVLALIIGLSGALVGYMGRQFASSMFLSRKKCSKYKFKNVADIK